MRLRDKGFWLLALASGCLLLTAWLPAHHKLLFVSETGHVGHSQTLNVVLIILLFARWRPARTLTLLLSGCQFLFALLIMAWVWKTGEKYAPAPYVGYSLVALLHLVVLKVLNDSQSVRAFLDKPANTLNQPAT
ncbi:hypothetical protein [Hymenobacter ruber]